MRLLLFCFVWLSLSLRGQAQTAFRWQQAYGSSANEYGGQAVPVAGGGYLLIGVQSRLGGMAADLYSVRVDAAGNQLASKAIPMPGVFNPGLASVTPVEAGNVVVTGFGTGYAGADYAAFIAKLNPNGDTLWTRLIDTPDYDYADNVVLATDGNYTALFSSGVAPNPVPTLYKFNAATGATIWFRSLKPTLQTLFPAASYVIRLQKKSGGYWVYTNGSNGTTSNSGFLELDQNGQLSRARLGPYAPANFPSTTTLDPAGNILVGGSQMLTKLSSQGDTLWHRTYPSAYQWRSWEARAIVQEPGGGYALLGDSRLAQPGGGPNTSALHLVRVSAQGQMIKDTLLYRPADTFGGSLFVTPAGEFVFSGATASGPLGGADLLMAQLRRVGPLATHPARAGLAGELQLYPNPTDGAAPVRLQVPAGLGGAAQVRVYDALGRLTYAQPLAAGAATAALPAPPRPGVYVVQLTAADGRRFSARLLRE